MILGKTNIGAMRKENQDSFYCCESQNKFMLVVSDGMGGHNAGSAASSIAVSAIKDYEKKHDVYKNTALMIKNMISYANEIIFLQSCSHKQMAGMGATIVMAVGNKNKVYIGNLGDSRAYVASKDSIKQITEDHSYVNELVKGGFITKEEARNHPKKNEILKAAGIGNEVFPDIFEVTLKDSETLLLCSDGLTNMVSDERILEILNSSEDNEAILSALINEANINGGYDNITAVIKN